MNASDGRAQPDGGLRDAFGNEIDPIVGYARGSILGADVSFHVTIQQAQAHIRHGAATLLALFHPASGQVRAKGAAGAPNTILYACLETELTTILAVEIDDVAPHRLQLRLLRRSSLAC